MTTLEGKIEKAPAHKKVIANQARKWLNEIDIAVQHGQFIGIGSDPDKTRAKVIEWILKLEK